MAIFEASSRKTSWLLGLLISLFLALDLFLLGLNFHITKQVSEDALVINLASRQSTLIQQMSNAVSQIDTNKLSASESQILTDQFSSAYLLFSQTLNAFITVDWLQMQDFILSLLVESIFRKAEIFYFRLGN